MASNIHSNYTTLYLKRQLNQIDRIDNRLTRSMLSSDCPQLRLRFLISGKLVLQSATRLVENAERRRLVGLELTDSESTCPRQLLGALGLIKVCSVQGCFLTRRPGECGEAVLQDLMLPRQTLQSVVSCRVKTSQ